MAIITVTFLGTGTAIPTVERRHSAIHLDYQGRESRSILFDCGEGTQTRLLEAKINFMSIDQIYITHWHADHFLGIFGLLVSMGFENRKREMKIFGPHANNIGPKLLSFYKLPFKIKFIDTFKEGVVFEDDEIIVDSMKVKHTVDSVAYRLREKDRFKLDKNKIKKLGLSGEECKKIKEKGKLKKDGKTILLDKISNCIEGKKIVYSGDTVYLKKMEKFSEGATLIHECTYFDKEEIEYKNKMHSSFDDVIKLRKFADMIYLTHIGRKYHSPSELEKKVSEFKRVFIVRDLQKIKV